MKFLSILQKDKPLNPNSQQSRFGIIHTSILHYITPLMIIVAGIIIGIIAANIPTLAQYFNTNIYLNGLIIFLLSVALIRAFANNYTLYKTANFLKEVEDVCEEEVIDPNKVDRLHRKLIKSAYFIDTQNMHAAIENIKTFEILNLTDNDCRLIKHKLGYRIGLKRSEVGFAAGILVMLGLLGTFLGLLKTIDAVGLALGSMSSVSNDSGGVDEAAMTDFISSLSAPLQGMGLAFSSSLFGLSGSLLIGYFNHLCGGAQDKFIENVGRWLDNRIPKFKPEDDVMPDEQGLATEDDLRSWLAGFVYLSVKTNKKIGFLVQSLVDNIRQQNQNEEYLKKIATLQDETVSTTRTFASTLSEMKTQNASYHSQSIDLIAQTNNHTATLKAECLTALQNLSRDLSINQTKISENIEQITNGLNQSMQGMSEANFKNTAALEQLNTNSASLSSAITNNTNILNAKLESLNESNHNTNVLFNDVKNISQDSNQKLLKICEALQETFEIQKNIQTLLNTTQASTSADDHMREKLERSLFEINALLNKIDQIDSDVISKTTGVDVNKPTK